MLFNSPEFLFLFLPLTLMLFAWTARRKAVWSQAVLVVASMAFYAYWDATFLLILMTSLAINFYIGQRLSAHPSRRLLAAGVAANILLLGYFKYTNFIVMNINAITGSGFPNLSIVLPLGISFFTFQKIAYLVDAHRGEVHDRSPLRFSLFVLFFPQLIAGPIVHHKEVIPQFSETARRGGLPPAPMVASGLALLLLGLFKKVVIADSLARYVTPAFGAPEGVYFLEAWTAVLAYTLQLYFDFSAYSEMAMGIAQLFGVRLPVNFNAPYKAANITDFWRRWHITLGRFLRDYVYVPFGGNRSGTPRTIMAVVGTMFIGGLWHGASWNFVIWGFMHGCYLAVHKIWTLTKYRLSVWAGRSLTFFAVLFSWVMFRASTAHDAVTIWRTMLGGEGVVLPGSLRAIADLSEWGIGYRTSSVINGVEFPVLLVITAFVFMAPTVHDTVKKLQPSWRWLAVLGGLTLISLFQISRPSDFIYWQF